MSSDDPRLRMEQFVKSQHGAQRREDDIERVWTEILKEFTPDVKSVADVLREKGHTDLHVETGFNQLHVWFDTRPMGRPRFTERARVFDAEAGAEAIFVCQEGVVRGYRRPFRRERQSAPFEPFVELGSPQAVERNALANSVGDFLQWAAVGGGRGSRPLAL